MSTQRYPLEGGPDIRGEQEVLRIVGDDAHAVMALAILGFACLRVHREHDCGDVDGSFVQDEAIRLGLLEYVAVGAPCGEACVCEEYYGAEEWPVRCLRYSDALALFAQNSLRLDEMR